MCEKEGGGGGFNLHPMTVTAAQRDIRKGRAGDGETESGEKES